MFFQLALLSLLASAVSPQNLDVYGAGKTAPWRDSSADEFDDLLVNEEDAGGRYPLGGRDITIEYQESARYYSPGWALTVHTKADIAIADSNSTYTGTRIGLEVPDAKNVDDTWQLCVLEWRPDPDNLLAAPRQDDGSCSKSIGEDCKRDLQAAVVEKYEVSNGRTACACPSIAEIGSCGGDTAKQVLTGGGACQARTFNATQIRDWPDGKFTVLQYGGHPRTERGNQTDYNLIGSIAWPVLVMWGQAQNQSSSFALNNHAQLACVRAVNATSKSNLPAPGFLNDGQARKAPGTAMALFCVSVVVMAGLI